MTNFDLEEIYEFLSNIRYNPRNQKNIILLDRLLDVLNENSRDSIDFRKILYEEDETAVRQIYSLIPEPRQKIHIEDGAVYTFFSLYFDEIKHLCLTNKFNQVFFLIDMLDNLPKEIIKNDLFLPIRYLKKRLFRYWIKYDRGFLQDFLHDNKYVFKS